MSNERSKRALSVILRGMNHEPSAAYALEMQPSGRYVNVSGSYPPPSHISWPLNDAFDYDKSMLIDLRTAFENGDKEELARLYTILEQRPRIFVDTLMENHAKRESRIRSGPADSCG